MNDKSFGAGMRVSAGFFLCISWVVFGLHDQGSHTSETGIGLRVNIAGTMDSALASDVLLPKRLKRDIYRFPSQLTIVDPTVDTDGDGVPDTIDANPKSTGVLSNMVIRVPYLGKNYVFRLGVSSDYLNVYRTYMPHSINANGDNAADFVVRDEPYIAELVKQARDFEARDPKVKAENLLVALVQNIPYNADAYTGKMEYPKYPIETLADQSGDCEDLSILTVNLLGQLKGYDQVAFVFFGDHIGVGIRGADGAKTGYQDKGQTFVYQETTDPAWSRGQVPDAYRKKTPIIYRVS